MRPKASHLYRSRHGIWYFRWCVPEEFRKRHPELPKELARSTKTAGTRHARPVARRERHFHGFTIRWHPVCTASASIELRWMIHNAFVDGALFRSGPSADKRPLVADMLFGIKLELPRTRTSSTGPLFLQFTATQRTPEFRSPAYRVPSRRFGALTVGAEF